MARPAFLLCDTDAIIQLLLAKEIRPLRTLHSKYGIQPLIVPEVEIELNSSKKFSKRIAPELKRALGHNVIRVLDLSILESHFGGPPGGAAAAAAAMSQIATIGRTYQRIVDLGEAYTHAAALTLGAPALSHDRSALDALNSAGHKMPSTVLRAYDLIGLCHQTNTLTEVECDNFVSIMKAEGEYVPRCFWHKSYADGIGDFPVRVFDSTCAPIGSSRAETFSFAEKLVL